MEENVNGIVLQFAPFQSAVDEGFWRRLSSLKLDTLGIDQSPIPIIGFYAPCSHAQVSNHLTLLAESLPPDPSEQSSSPAIVRGNRNRCPVPGILYNTNTLESFHAFDKQSLLKAEAKKIWDDICSGKAEEDSAVLSRFLLISFADLKKWSFHYWFAFPALSLDPPAVLTDLRPASQWFSLEETDALSAACNEWRNSSSTADVPFFLVSIASSSHVNLRPLSDWKACQGESQKLLFGFYDPCHLPSNPGWPLRNFLSLICSRWNISKVRFLCYREKHGFADLSLSLVGEALVSVPQGRPAENGDPQLVPNAVGWELNKGRRVPRCISLANSMDPKRLAISAADLNLKLMRWRVLPSLNLNLLSTTKCLLLGAGTLGCQVARMLMAWGVRKVTLLDSGRVAMSNPLRQSLYTFDDSLNGGDLKAIAAVKSLKRIFPAMEAEGVVMAIPMPGHPVPTKEEDAVLEDCRHLRDLIACHDAVFLLTDTRESRWLPTLLCADANKITITAALGFDSFVVMRHGADPLGSTHDINDEAGITSTYVTDNLSQSDGDGQRQLGCYFCNDVVAPVDSTANRTLDQQCTVTRPGLAPIASSLAVELFVGILHHPDGMLAPARLPVVRVDAVSNLLVFCHIRYEVVSEYRKRGMEFVLQAINHPTYLEDLTGLTELKNSASSFRVDWDNETVDDDSDAEIPEI